MPGDNSSFIISCPGCNAKLRLNETSRGKTIACPKCGKQMKIKEAATATAPTQTKPAAPKPVSPQPASPQPASPKPVAQKPASPKPVAAKPASPKPVAAKPVQAKPVAPAAPQDDWADLQIPSAPTAYQPQAGYPSYYAPAKPKANITVQQVIKGVLAVMGGIGLLGFVSGILFAIFRSSGSTTPNSAQMTSSASGGSGAKPTPGTASVPGSLPGSAPPRTPSGSNAPVNFPELGMTIPAGNKAVMHRMEVLRPGRPSLSLQIFIPKGEHAAQSLPVVFEAPAGTTLLHGARLDFKAFGDDIPFTDAGMITVNFSLDGPMPDGLTPESGSPFFSILARSYKEFVDSDAGVECGSLAIDYVLKKLSIADPKRLYVSGHSSAATLSLLLASKDSRISKCIAFAPCTDLNARLGELLTEPTIQKTLPNLADYFKTGSPITYVGQLKCPVFIVHAQDDDNEPFPNTKKYVSALKQAGGNVTFLEPPRGGHYQVMLEAAIPKAIEWVGK